MELLTSPAEHVNMYRTGNISLNIYLWNFVKTVKQFRFTLQFRSIQRLAQHGSNKEEMREGKYFKYTTNILCVGFLFIFVSLCISNLMKISISTLFFSDCFPISNLSPDIHFQISNEEQLHILAEIVHYSFMFAELLAMFGIFIGLVPFILVSSHSWYKLMSRAMRNKSNNYRIRGHEIY